MNMKDHNKLTFTAEYCRCRRIPYKIIGDSLYINKQMIYRNLYYLSYSDIIGMIDKVCNYDNESTYFISLN